MRASGDLRSSNCDLRAASALHPREAALALALHHFHLAHHFFAAAALHHFHHLLHLLELFQELVDLDNLHPGAVGNALAAAERQLAAEATILNDPYVQGLMRDYGARIVPGSIQPV